MLLLHLEVTLILYVILKRTSREMSIITPWWGWFHLFFSWNVKPDSPIDPISFGANSIYSNNASSLSILQRSKSFAETWKEEQEAKNVRKLFTDCKPAAVDITRHTQIVSEKELIQHIAMHPQFDISVSIAHSQDANHAHTKSSFNTLKCTLKMQSKHRERERECLRMWNSGEFKSASIDEIPHR